MKGAEVLVKMLALYDVEVIFGVPGDTSIPLYEALYDSKEELRHVMARDERSASFMADAYARISHKPGICECPSGAGALYSLPGVAEADASSVPVILFTSDNPINGEGKKTITELDCQRLFEPITKWSCLIKDTSRIPEIIRRGFRIATTGRPGAVHLAIPQESLKDQYEQDSGNIYSEAECASYPAFRTRGSRTGLEQLARLLDTGGKTIIVAGGGAKHSQAEIEVIALAELMHIPVVTTISGQGIMPDHHPLALGVIGDNGFHPHAIRAVEESDTLFYIGCKIGSVSTIKWTLPSFNPERKILQVDLDPVMLGNNYKNSISVAGDAKLVLRDLLALLEESGSKGYPTDWFNDLNHARQLFWQESEKKLVSTALPIKPQQVIASMNKHLGPGAIVIADAGTPTPYITRYLRLRDHQSTFIIPRAFGGLGYAIPAVVGAHFARPDAPLVGLFGDGSLGMSAGELETLVRLNIPAVLIHFNNSCFGWIKALQSIYTRDKFFSVDFSPMDPAKVAEGFGMKAMRISHPDMLESALKEAFSTQGPVFLDVVSESEVTELPPVYSWMAKLNGAPQERLKNIIPEK
ncbi:MAG: thiamine pyrophosphate-binding protein [Desulfobacteraceae bacterium]|nr:thiamine pyrophosphate-binding protein [Desulfobacteraceae bacterium]